MSYLAWAALLLVGFFPLTVLAAEPVRPLYARPAQTLSDVSLDGFVEYFDGLKLQEAVDLRGWTAGLDLTLPLSRSMQLRALVPVRTDAQGTLVNGDGDIDIKGWGGTFRFTTLYFEHQIAGTGGGANRLAWHVGVGQRTAVLETDTPDRYNHRGRSLHLGLRYDRVLAGGGALLLDVEVRSYEESDDLNPGNTDDDRFTMSSVRAGWFAARRGRWTPGAELIADVSDNHFAVAVVPEIHLKVSDSLDLKLGVPIGVSSDAPDLATQFRMTVRF